MAQLVVVKGPLLGRTFDIGDGAVIGRSLDCEVHLDDLTVSRMHARLTQTDKGVVVEDMHSGNGTYVGKERIEKPTLLKHNSLVGVSNHVFKFVNKQVKRRGGMGSSTVVAVERPVGKESSSILGRIPVQEADIGAITARAKAGGQDAILKAHERLRTIVAISNAVQTELNQKRLLDLILQNLFQVFPQADRGFIMLKDKLGEMVPRAAWTRSGQTEEITISKTLIREAAEKRVAILSADAMGDDRFGQAVSIVNFQIRSMMCAPLIAGDDLLGLIHIDTVRQAERFSDDDLELLTGVANQTALAVANARMHDELLLRDRMTRDLQLAALVQQSFLPERTPEFSGVEFAATYQAAQAVGGDFYDFIGQGPDRMLVVVGDVSGKGVPAALLMAKMTSDVRFFSLQEREPKDIVARLNDHMTQSNIEDAFVTLMIAAVDMKQHTIALSNAAHCPAILRRARAGDAIQIATEGNFPLGVMPDTKFEQQTYPLDPGDVVFIFTDGVTEAMNASDDVYGFDRLERAVATAPGSAEGVLQYVAADIKEHVGDTPQSDDVTCVCIGLKDPADGPKSAGQGVA